MDKVYNFSSGPAVLPKDVMVKANSEFMNYKNSGMSVMEMSHRSQIYLEIMDNAEKSLREIMNIPAGYKVLFLQGGATLQFSMVPLNLLNNSKNCAYINTGLFASKAIKEAKRYGNVFVPASSEDKNFSYIPDLDSLNMPKDCSYLHITQNNTVFGTKYKKLPDEFNVPIVSDVSSMILSEEIDVSKYGLLYAGAQKNIGPAGLTIVIIREDLLGHANELTPNLLNYDVHAKEDSKHNTPPTYSIYIAGLVFDYLKEAGGVSEINKINVKKANLLYEKIDSSNIYRGGANKDDRSIMNVTFFLPTKELDDLFAKQAEQRGFMNLKGHRAAGGLRASIYNAMNVEGVLALIDFMNEFESKI